MKDKPGELPSSGRGKLVTPMDSQRWGWEGQVRSTCILAMRDGRVVLRMLLSLGPRLAHLPLRGYPGFLKYRVPVVVGGVVGCGLWVGMKAEGWQPVQVRHSLSVRLFLLVWAVPRLWLSTRRNSESWLKDSIRDYWWAYFLYVACRNQYCGGDVGVVWC